MTAITQYKKNSALFDNNNNYYEEENNEHFLQTNNKIEIRNENKIANQTIFLYDIIKELYNCNNEEFSFVLRNNLNRILIEAPNIINNHFYNFKLSLKLNDDYDDGDKILFLIIKSSATIKQSIKQMKSLFKEWNLIKQHSYNKYLTIITETE